MVAKLRSSNDFLSICLFCKLFWSRKLKKTFLPMHRVIIRSTHYCSHFSATTKFRCIDIVVVILIWLNRFKFWKNGVAGYILYNVLQIWIVFRDTSSCVHCCHEDAHSLVPWYSPLPFWFWEGYQGTKEWASSICLFRKQELYFNCLCTVLWRWNLDAEGTKGHLWNNMKHCFVYAIHN